MMMPLEEILVLTWMIQVFLSEFPSTWSANNSSGFFSVQVLEEALNIWQLTFVKITFHSWCGTLYPLILASFAGVLKL